MQHGAIIRRRTCFTQRCAKTLGTHVKQAGSLVAPDRLRFDFTHYTGLAEQDLLDIEDLVNQQTSSRTTWS